MMPQVRADPESELDEFTLVRAQRGDEDACRALFSRHQRAVYGMCSRLLHDPARIEDVVQETFLRVFAALPRFDRQGPAKLSTWILTIAIRLCRDEARKRRRRHGAQMPAWVETEAVAADVPVQRRAELVAVDAAIRALPDGMREALVLSCVDGLSTAEVAAVLGVEPGTVKSRVSRARQKLKATLAEACHDR